MEIIQKSPISSSYLKKFNTVAGFLHLAQGIVMIIIGSLLTWQRDIYTFYLKFVIHPGSSQGFSVVPNPQVAFTLGYVGVIAASFLLISAAAHFLISFGVNARYNNYLKRGMNPYRWYEYAFSSSIMIFLIALIVGVWDLWSLVMIFVLNAMMIMFGYTMELLNQYTERTNWSPFALGTVSGLVPWVVLYAYFIAEVQSTGLNPPTFVYLILFIYFILFNIFAVNMVLQYKGVGKWKDYLYGERFYIILSLVAKSFLAWLVFVGIFAPF